jgi:hypothetical protein
MTEKQWLACRRPVKLLREARLGLSERKLRLLLVASCRRVWNLLIDERSRSALAVAERHADGRATDEELINAHRSAARAAMSFRDRRERRKFLWDQNFAATAVTELCSQNLWVVHPDNYWYHPYSSTPAQMRSHAAAVFECLQSGYREQIAIFRHIVGNPFRPYAAPGAWPTTVVALAESVYEGDSAARLPLHDALLECGHPALAEHCAADPIHPKGCWVIDLITGRDMGRPPQDG